MECRNVMKRGIKKERMQKCNERGTKYGRNVEM